MVAVVACSSDGAGPDDGPADAALSLVSITAPDGSTVTPTDAGGVVVFNLDVSTPSGFAGALTVTIGGREMTRETLGAQATAGAAGATTGASAGDAPRAVTVDLARYSATFVGERIEAVPFLVNGTHDVVIRVDGTARGRNVSGEHRTSIGVQQPDAHTALLVARGNTIAAGGTTWRAGDLTVVPVVVPFSSALVTEIRYLLDDRPASFTPATVGRGVLVATRNGAVLQNATLAAAALPYTSPAAGTRVWIDRIAYGSTIVDPQSSVQTFAGRCFDLDGDGFADASRTPGQPLPAGCTRFVQLPRLTAVLDPGAGRIPADQVFHWDNQGPAAAAHAFRLVDAPYTPGAPALAAASTYCCRDNWIGIDYDLRWGLDVSAVSDAGAGLAGAPAARFYVAPSHVSLDDLYTSPYEVPAVPNIATTPNSLSLVAGVSLFDALGNRTDVPLSTSVANAMSLTGVDPTPGDGTRAVLGSDQHRPTLAYNGTITGFIAFTSPVPGITLSATYADVGAGFASNPAFLRLARTGTCVYGTGNGCAQPEVIAGTPSGSSLAFSTVRGRVSGDAQGVYTGALGVRDRAGNLAAGFTTDQFWYLWDYTPPTTPVPPVPPALSGGASHAWPVQAADNTSLLESTVGFYVDGFAVSGFAEGRVHAPVGVHRGDGVGGLVQPALSGTASAPFVTHVIPIGSNGEPPSGSPFAVTHVYAQAVDEALNRGAVMKTALSSLPAAPPPITNVSNLAQGVSPNTVCGGVATSCTGLETTSTHTLRATTPLATPQPFTGAYLFAVGSDGNVRRLCAVTSPALSGSGQNLVFDYGCTVDWARTRADTLQLFWWAVNAAGLAWMTSLTPVFVL